MQIIIVGSKSYKNHYVLVQKVRKHLTEIMIFDTKSMIFVIKIIIFDSKQLFFVQSNEAGSQSERAQRTATLYI